MRAIDLYPLSKGDCNEAQDELSILQGIADADEAAFMWRLIRYIINT